MDRRRIVTRDHLDRSRAVGARVEGQPVSNSGQLPVAREQLQRRRLRRSPELLAAVRKLDVTPNPMAQAEIVAWLNEAYSETQSGVIVGLFSHCYLGHPYIDHGLSFGGEIIEHYRPGDTLPAVYAPARPLAMSTAYDYIEIYADGHVIPIRPDGRPSL